MVRFALADPTVKGRYGRWLQGDSQGSETHTPYGMSVGSVGFQEGQAVIWARPEADAFVLTGDHRQFRFVVAVGFDVANATLFGVYIRKFEGDTPLALTLARSATATLRARLEFPSQPIAVAANN